MSLATTYKSLISNGQLDKLKDWVYQTNLGNKKYIKENEIRLIEAGFGEFHYGECTIWSIFTAISKNHIPVLDFLLNSPDYLKKLDINEHSYSSSPLNHRENMTSDLFKFIVKSGYKKHMAQALFDHYGLKHEEKMSIVQDLTLHFCQHNDTFSIVREFEHWAPIESTEKNFRKECLKVAYQVLEVHDFQENLNESLDSNPQGFQKKNKL